LTAFSERGAFALLPSPIHVIHRAGAIEDRRDGSAADDSSRSGTSRRVTAASGHVTAATKRVVWQRDGGRCAFIGPHGRCTATAFLEYHHVVPFAAGGETSAKNLELRCRAHNQYEADRYFGPQHVPLVREARAVYGVIANSFQERVGPRGRRVERSSEVNTSATDLASTCG
jgi:5-methylcytosine-specific restriction endonuclease McrA